MLKGNLAPEGSVVKRSAVAAEMMHHKGPARVSTAKKMRSVLFTAGRSRPERLLSFVMKVLAEDPACARCLIPTSGDYGLRLRQFGGADHGRKILGRNARCSHRSRLA